MLINKEQIESVKQSNDIVALIKSRGIRLKKKGKNYIGLCPFHKEKTPSFTVDPVKQLYNCFGCSNNGKGTTGGDVIGFVVKHDNVTFKDAIEKLSNNSKPASTNGKARRTTHNSKTSPRNPVTCNSQPEYQKLLKRVVGFYHTTFTEDDKGLKYLTEKRKITDKTIFTNFKIGYANGTLLKTLPEDGDIKRKGSGLYS